MTGPAKTLVLGLGNILIGDEAVGVRAIEALQAGYNFPETVELLEGGTLGLDLLPYLEGVDRLLILDAIDAGAAPGTLIKLVGDEVPARLAIKMSPHQIGLSDLLAAARFQGSAPSEIVLMGMQPEQLEVKVELSKTVADQLPALVEAALAQLAAWEITFRPKSPG